MGLPYLVRAHLYVGGAHIYKRALRGRAVRRTSPSCHSARSKGSAFEPGPARTALLCRGQSYADSAPVRTAILSRRHLYSEGSIAGVLNKAWADGTYALQLTPGNCERMVRTTCQYIIAQLRSSTVLPVAQR